VVVEKHQIVGIGGKLGFRLLDSIGFVDFEQRLVRQDQAFHRAPGEPFVLY